MKKSELKTLKDLEYWCESSDEVGMVRKIRSDLRSVAREWADYLSPPESRQHAEVRTWIRHFFNLEEDS